jgi:L-ascorbate metabolism protein UlaG (beta-lactamase superfamily)
VTIDVVWLGHSTVVLDVDGRRLVSDPLLRRHAGLLRRRGDKPARALWDDADVVLLSHLHHDHADLRSLGMLPADSPIVTAPDNARWLRRHGLAGFAPADGAWLDVGAESTVSVALCPAVHHSRPMPHRPSAATGHVVRSRAGTVWLAGDTSVFAQMTRIPVQAGSPIDLAVVPISGWAPRLSGGHMGPLDAARACALVGARWAIPVHWGTLHTPGGRNFPRGWMDKPAADFVTAMAEQAPGCRVLVPRIGVRHSLVRHG